MKQTSTKSIDRATLLKTGGAAVAALLAAAASPEPAVAAKEHVLCCCGVSLTYTNTAGRKTTKKTKTAKGSTFSAVWLYMPDIKHHKPDFTGWTLLGTAPGINNVNGYDETNHPHPHNKIEPGQSPVLYVYVK